MSCFSAFETRIQGLVVGAVLVGLAGCATGPGLTGATIQSQYPDGSNASELSTFLVGNGYRNDEGYTDLLQSAQTSAARLGDGLTCYTGRPGPAFAVCYVVQPDGTVMWQPVGIE